MVKILIPTPLRKFTNGESSVEIEAGTVSEAIQNLSFEYPAIKQHVYDADDEIRKFLRIYVGEEDIQQLNGAETKLNSGDKLSIIPAIAGGKSQ